MKGEGFRHTTSAAGCTRDIGHNTFIPYSGYRAVEQTEHVWNDKHDPPRHCLNPQGPKSCGALHLHLDFHTPIATYPTIREHRR